MSIIDFLKPMPPDLGPPLPMGIAAYLPFDGYWPWYTVGSGVTEWVCPYDGQVFDSLAALQEHVITQHPGERIPIMIKWH